MNRSQYMVNHLAYVKERWSYAQAGIKMIVGLEDYYSRALLWGLVSLNIIFGL